MMAAQDGQVQIRVQFHYKNCLQYSRQIGVKHCSMIYRIRKHKPLTRTVSRELPMTPFRCSKEQYTVWFKINLTLFETHISHKSNSIMNLFDNIYKAWYLGMMWWKLHQNWCSNTETRPLFWQTVKKNFTHTQNQWSNSYRRVY